MSELAPAQLVTVMMALPAACGGAVTVSDVGDDVVAMASTPAKCTVGPAPLEHPRSRVVPVIVTLSPMMPLVGDTDVTVGANGYERRSLAETGDVSPRQSVTRRS